MKRFAFALLLALVGAPYLSAHEGHDHKIMGTLSAIHETSVDVKQTDGKLQTITLNDKTKIVRGTATMKLADLKAGDRVVVTATGGGKDPFVAKEIKLGAAKTAAAKTTAKK